MKKFLSLSLTALLAFVMSGHASAWAETESVPQSASQPSNIVRGPHGGKLHQAGGLQIEAVVAHSGLQVFVYDREGQPASVAPARGVASILVEGGAKRYRYDLLPDNRGALAVAVNLAKIAGRQIEMNFQLVGFAPSGSTPIAFSEVTMVPESQQQLTAAAIARQKSCPVSGKPLGSMGGPIKVMVGDKPIFLCCKGCIKKVQAEPAQYLTKVYGNASPAPSQSLAALGGEEVRPGVFKTTAADAQFIAAQKLCPVMDEPLDAMGGPYRVNADGRAIYICCPGCAKKIAVAPQKYVATLAEQGVNAPALR